MKKKDFIFSIAAVLGIILYFLDHKGPAYLMMTIFFAAEGICFYKKYKTEKSKRALLFVGLGIIGVMCMVILTIEMFLG